MVRGNKILFSSSQFYYRDEYMVRRKLIKLLAVILMLIVLISTAFPVLPTLVSASPEEATLPRVALIKMWSVNHTCYMAKFYGEKYLVVFSVHGDVSLDGRYISAWGKAWVYKVETGELLAELEANDTDGAGDTWRVISWEPFRYEKVYPKQGFFSADSKRMIENVRIFGTNASVVDTTTWTTIPIDWGFNAGGFYANQLDYYGTTVVAGHMATGTLYVYKYDPAQGKYVKVFEHQESGNYGRRLHQTLDGKYIVVGGMDYSYLDIWEWDASAQTYKRVVHYQLPDSEGLGALGISDPYNVGYVIGGTINSWVIIAHFDPSTKEFKVLLQERVAEEEVFFYNPFYERWVPKRTEVFAICSHRDTTHPGIAVIYDVLTNDVTTIRFADPGTPQWSASAVSPEANYVFVGNTMYMVVRRDVQSGNPRVRFWGVASDFRPSWHLIDPIVISAPPNKDWHAYIYGGTVYVQSLYTEAIRDSLVKDPVVRQGLIGKMYEKGLIELKVALIVEGEVEEIVTNKADLGKGIDRSVVVTSVTAIKRAWRTGEIAIPVVVKIPLDKPIDPYSSITLTPNLVVTLGAKVQDSRSGEIIGTIAIGGGVASATVGAKLMASAWSIASQQVFAKYAVAGLADATKLATIIAGEAHLYSSIGAILTGVGAIIALVATIDTLYEWFKAGADAKLLMMIVPVITDITTGEKYACGALYLPLEAIEAGEQKKYIDHIKSVFSLYGIDKVGIAVYSFGKTWEEYRGAISKGYLPRPNLLEVINSTIITPYGLSRENVKISEVLMIFEQYIYGSTSIAQKLTGGIKVYSTLQITGFNLDVVGVIPGGEVITDPDRIAKLLGTVKIDGVEYALTPSDLGAKADFATQIGVESLKIEFGKAGYFADIYIPYRVMIKKDFEPLEDFGYVADFHYDWKNTLVRIERIELVDMPYPMVYVERTFIYKYGNFTHDMTEAFELSGEYNDPTSPTLKRYTYVTHKNTKYLDPANGGMLQPCKRYIIRYFYREPPDVKLYLYLNGTRLTSTKARHASVVLNSTVEQDVEYVIMFRVKKFEEGKEVTLLEEGEVGTMHVYPDRMGMKPYLIEKYVDYAVRVMAEEKIPAFVEIYAKITKAKYNYIKENDEKTVVYYPPFSIIERYNKTAKLSIYVYNPINGSDISGALVRVYNKTEYTAYTNATGWAGFTLMTGLWNIEVTKDGYQPYTTQLFVYDNMTFNVPLVPENVPVPVPAPVNNTNPPVIIDQKEYWWLSVQVVYKDGMPFHGARVRVYDADTDALLFEKLTNGTGFVHFLVQNGTNVRVEVNATNPADPTQTYSESRTFTITKHTWLVFTLPWTSEYFQPEVGIVSVEVVTHLGAGYYFGNVSHLVMLKLWTNTPQVVTVNLTFLDAGTNETLGFKQLVLNLTEGINVNMTWFDVNATEGKYVRAHAVIVSYENDTDPANNELWSKVVYLKPFVDIRVFVRWRPVETKLPYAILPGDIIEIDVGIWVPVNLTKIPMNLTAKILSRDIVARVFKEVEVRRESVKVVVRGIVWRNFTLTVPWTNKIMVEVNASHPWEMYALNNNITTVITIDPDIELENVIMMDRAKYVVEGSKMEFKVRIRSNVEPGEGSAFVVLYDETTYTEMASEMVTLEPEMELRLTGTAPENPYAWKWEIKKIGFKIGIKKPTATHLLNCTVSGTDFYLENNYKGMEITVVSYQMAFALGILVLAVILILLFSLARGARSIIPYRPRKYVRFKSL